MTVKPYIVMGGQYGSEGKGEVAARLALGGVTGTIHLGEYPTGVLDPFDWSIRTGGPNAGHTVHHDGKVVKMRHIPCAVVNPGIQLALGPGALINLEVLRAEIEGLKEAGWWGPKGKRVLMVDRAATMVGAHNEIDEHSAGMRERIGSTMEGVGSARAANIMRKPGMKAGDPEWRQEWEGMGKDVHLTDVAYRLGTYHRSSKFHFNVLVESTQGWELSLNHSGHYPYATSTDLTPPQILNDAGVLFKTDYKVHVVVRTFPIRVAGNSGPLPFEHTWEEMGKITRGYVKAKKPELTTVTGLPRRIAGWDKGAIERMVVSVKPDYATLTFLDYKFPEHAWLKSLPIAEGTEVAGYLDKIGADLHPTELVEVATGPGVFVNLREVPR